jgi:acyl-coenzyme A synthetase/AMP-(fatty) acid ligase
MPLVVTFLKQDGLSKTWNTVITVLACGAAGAITVWATGGFDHLKLANLIGVIAVVYVASQAAYQAYWKGTGTEALINIKSSIIKTSNPETLV